MGIAATLNPSTSRLVELLNRPEPVDTLGGVTADPSIFGEVYFPGEVYGRS